MKKIAFTVDVEKDFGKDSYTNLKNLSNLNKVLKKRGIKATFFVTSDCLQKYPSLFKRLENEGHEIALHGYLHERWDVLTKKEKEEKLENAIAVYRKIFKRNPRGFRAPQFSADFELIELLNRKKFVYDSSIVQFPLTQAIFFPSRLPLYLKQCLIRFRIRNSKMKIWEIIISSFGLPISAFTLRKLPREVFSILHELAYIQRGKGHRRKGWMVFLAHSYELNGRMMKLLEEYFEKNKNAQFVTMENLLK
jgi:peptidoglycan/xylan/chitin deacetylase (PgdA/CDA1 family)